MRRIKIFLEIVFTFFIFHSCIELSTDDAIVGDNFGVSPSLIYNVDTMTLDMSTIMVDSIATISPSRMLAGSVTDPVGVKTYAESYFQLKPAATRNLLESAVYDSALFRIKIDEYHIGDTTQIAKFGLFRVIESMEPADDEKREYYAHDQYVSEDKPWAVFEVDLTKTVNPKIDLPEKIEKHRVVEARLKDDIGLELYNLVAEDSDVLESEVTFTDKYSGFVIKPLDEAANLLVGFISSADSSITPEIQVYYHDNTLNKNLSMEYSYRYTTLSNATNNSIYTFNHIETDFSASPFKEIQSGESILNSPQSNSTTYIYSGANVQTRFDLRDIDYLFTDKATAVLSATLIFEPAEGSFNDFFPLPQVLNLDLLNFDNSIAGYIMQLDGSTRAAAYLVSDEEFNNYTYYCDITRYFKDIYDKTLEKNTSGLPQDMGSIKRGFSIHYLDSRIGNTVERLTLGDFKNNQNGIKLEVVFISN